MDSQAMTFCCSTQATCKADSLPEPRPASAAHTLLPAQRQELALEILGGKNVTIAALARQHDVSRKFLTQQADIARDALADAFQPQPKLNDVLFYLPVTKAWVHQLVLALLLICHSSYRGVIVLLRDLFDFSISLGTVHNVAGAATAQAQRLNAQYDLSPITVGAHDEIFQASLPVLVGVDTASTFCYLLSAEAHCDADTWGIRLLELVDRGFAPEATVADGGKALRAGQALALLTVPCRGDVFHLFHDGETLTYFLEQRAYKAIAASAPRPPRPPHSAGRPRIHPLPPAMTPTECAAAVQLFDDVTVLLDWLRHDVLAVAGPDQAERRLLYDFVRAELKARVPLCPHRLQPFCQTMTSQRDAFLDFAGWLDAGLARLAAAWALAPEVLRRVLLMLSRDNRDPRRWTEEKALREALQDRFRAVCALVTALARQTMRSSALAENLNSRLRGYFFLRRSLGGAYLSLLQFYLNHSRLMRSECATRVGKSPAELLTGREHGHWLELLGFARFRRA